MLRLLAIVAMLAATPALATEHVVKMLNKGSDGERMVFEPAVILAEPGDTLRFVPTDRGHNAATVKGAFPDGAETFKGRLNKEVIYEVTETGVHLVQCSPHWGMGMIALIVSGGDFSNVEAVQDVRMSRKTKERFEAYLQRAKENFAG